jgi:CheY-like chemotaxis protein
MPRILLVDDDDSFRKMLRITLVKMGYDVREARNGKEALGFFEQEQPDVVMTDLVMPEKEGLETIMELRRKQHGVKIIAMSGGGRVSAKDYLRIAKAMGADRVLAKPFSNDELRLALDGLLGTGVS